MAFHLTGFGGNRSLGEAWDMFIFFKLSESCALQEDDSCVCKRDASECCNQRIDLIIYDYCPSTKHMHIINLIWLQRVNYSKYSAFQNQCTYMPRQNRKETKQY